MIAENLTKEFNEQGYLFVPNFFDDMEMKDIKEKMDDFILNIAPGLPTDKVFYEASNDTTSIKQIFHLSDYYPYFEGLLRGSKIETMAENLLGEKTGQGFVEYFNKPAGVGKPTPPHQDCYYFMLTPPQALTFWIPLEDVDEENGCLRYVTGSHTRGIRPHGRTQTLGFSQGITDFGKELDIDNEVPVPAQTGDVLVHHSMTIHRADGNNSANRSRKVLGIVYFGESAQEDKEAKESYRKQLEKERAHYK